MNICCKIKIHFSTKTFSALCWGQIATTVELILLFSLSLFWSWFTLLSCELSVCPVLNWSAFLLKERVTKIFFCFLNIFYCNSIKPIKKINEVKLDWCVGCFYTTFISFALKAQSVVSLWKYSRQLCYVVKHEWHPDRNVSGLKYTTVILAVLPKGSMSFKDVFIYAFKKYF